MPIITKTRRGFNVKHTTREVWGVDDPSETHTPEEFEKALAGFLAAAQAKVDARFAGYAPLQSGKVEIERGPKYIRIVEQTFVNEHSSGRSAFCFIDRENGNVLKPAGWKGPEKRNPRSTIFADDFGASGVTGYGTTYLR
jgi:hypothetical protein